MKQSSVGRGIYMLSGILCLVLLGISAYAVISILSLRKCALGLSDDVIPGLIDSGTINSNQAENQIRSAELLLVATPEDRKRIREEMAAISKSNAASIKSYQDSIFSEEDRRGFETFSKARAEFLKVREEYFKLLETDQAVAKEYFLTKLLPAYTSYSKVGDILMAYNVKTGKVLSAEIKELVRKNILILSVSGSLAVLFGATFSILSARRIIKSLHHITTTIRSGSEQTVQAASQVSSSSQKVANGASEQAAALEETSASLEEISSMTRRNAENATHAKDEAGAARSAADVGVSDMSSLSKAMDGIKASSDDISQIIKTIDEIAFQTNILALNAAVEAARAGEAGAGFAVVADEVRNLAQRAASAAKESTEKIEGAIARANQGVELNKRVEKSLAEIADRIRRVDTLVQEIAAASGQQTTGISQVTKAVTEMDRVTQSNAAGAEEGASAAEELNAQAVTLQSVVEELAALAGATKS